MRNGRARGESRISIKGSHVLRLFRFTFFSPVMPVMDTSGDGGNQRDHSGHVFFSVAAVSKVTTAKAHPGGFQ